MIGCTIQPISLGVLHPLASQLSMLRFNIDLRVRSQEIGGYNAHFSD